VLRSRGTQPTVSDADLVLGYLDPSFYAAGSLELDATLAELAIEEHIAEPLGISVVEAAKLVKRQGRRQHGRRDLQGGIHRGFDPRRVTLLSYGGAGPVHCCGFAQALGVTRVLVPPFSSVFSALAPPTSVSCTFMSDPPTWSCTTP